MQKHLRLDNLTWKIKDRSTNGGIMQKPLLFGSKSNNHKVKIWLSKDYCSFYFSASIIKPEKRLLMV